MISLEWVKDYIDISNEDLHELAVKITTAGINVEKVITKHIDNLVIGKVVECYDHPNSDHLHICKVDIGTSIVQIVCGAPNVRKDIKVLVALPGAILPGNVKIQKGLIRGEESNGMLCALYELGLEEKTPETHSKGIEVLDTDLLPGTDANDYLKTNDTLYELDIHKHRNNDCYYHIGFAYEIACILNKKVTLPKLNYREIKDNINDHFQLDVRTPKCPYYLAKMVTNVTITDSPDFIKRRLIAAGMRPINNVVDISNYVMLEFGQPLHFFDKDKLGSKIIVRDAKDDEEVITLDNKKRILTSKDIVIANENTSVCIAGVMGGENTEVDDQTYNILIESAIFDPISIRYTASRLNLKSEASIRYGKGLNYEYTKLALDRACHLLEKYAHAQILEGTLVHDTIDKTPKTVDITSSEINNLLGMNLQDTDIATELDRLDFPYVQKDDKFHITIPKRRLDIDPNVNDIAEEIGRLYGYQNLKSTLPHVATKKGQYIGDVHFRKQISKRLRTLGLNECKTYTLVSPDMAKVFKYETKDNAILPNPMSNDKSILRTTIIPSLINVYDYNTARGLKDIFLYEIAKTYDANYTEDTKIALLMKGNLLSNPWHHLEVKVDFYLVKGIIENLLDYLGFKDRYKFQTATVKELHPGISAKILLDDQEIGIIGRTHPSYKKDEIYVAELSMTALYNQDIKPLKFQEASKYPAISKDLALIADQNITSETIKNQIKKSGGSLLKNIELFDIYQDEKLGSNKKSLAFTLTFSDPTRTLSDEEVMQIFTKIIAETTTALNVTL